MSRSSPAKRKLATLTRYIYAVEWPDAYTGCEAWASLKEARRWRRVVIREGHAVSAIVKVVLPMPKAKR